MTVAAEDYQRLQLKVAQLEASLASATSALVAADARGGGGHGGGAGGFDPGEFYRDLHTNHSGLVAT